MKEIKRWPYLFYAEKVFFTLYVFNSKIIKFLSDFLISVCINV